jgi:hypothetical protein
MAERLRLGEGVRAGLLHILERWDGNGGAHGLAGDDIALSARFSAVATQAVIFDRLGGPDAALEMVRQDKLDLLRRAVLLHDLGRVAISSSVWEQPRALTAIQWEQVCCEHERRRQTKKVMAGLLACGAVRGDGGGLVLRCRPAGGGTKPPRGALVEDCRAERGGKGAAKIASGVGREDERWARCPLPLTCRKLRRRLQNRGSEPVSGRAWGIPAYRPGGVRHIGSMIPILALVRNVRRRAPIAPAG